MRAKLLTILFFISVLAVRGQEAGTAFGLKSGFNASIFSASINSESGFKAGFHFGLYFRTPIGGKWHFTPEIYYSGQGQKDNYITPPNGPSIGKTTTRLNYLNLPFIFETGRKVTFQFGPQFGFLLSGTEKGEFDNTAVDDDLKDVMTTADLGLVLGMGVYPIDHLNFGLRMNYGLTDIFKGDPDIQGFDFPAIKNRVFHFYFGYSF